MADIGAICNYSTRSPHDKIGGSHAKTG